MRSVHAIIAVTGTAALLGACGPSNEAAMERDETAAAHAMTMDSATMRRHMQEMDSATAVVRAHVTALRGRTAEQWHSGMADHVRTVGGMLSMMDRHMREMGMHAEGAHAQHGAGQGGMMHGDAHAEMMTAATRLREELGTLQTADRAAVAAAMPAHLDRVDAFLALIHRNHEQHQQHQQRH